MRDIAIQDLQRALFGDFRGCFAMMGTAYLEESADATQSNAFVAAGFFCVDPQWKSLRRAWRRVLRPHGIPYYRTADWRSLEGSFKPLREKWGNERARAIADKVRSRLIDVLNGGDLLIGFGFGVNMHDFWEIDRTPDAKACRQWMRECHDYHAYGFRNVFGKIIHTVMQLGDGDNYVFFEVDDSSRFPKVKRAYDRFKRKYPELGERMLSLVPMDDKKIPELQMADLLADVGREMTTRHIVTRERAEPSCIKERILNFDCAHRHSMLRVLSGEAASMQDDPNSSAAGLTLRSS